MCYYLCIYYYVFFSFLIREQWLLKMLLHYLVLPVLRDPPPFESQEKHKHLMLQIIRMKSITKMKYKTGLAERGLRFYFKNSQSFL